MFESTPTPPIGGHGGPSHPSAPAPLPGMFPAPGGAYQPGGGWHSFEKWLGKKNYETFKKNLCNAIVQQINKNKVKEHEAAERLKRAETGGDLYEDI